MEIEGRGPLFFVLFRRPYTLCLLSPLDRHCREKMGRWAGPGAGAAAGGSPLPGAHTPGAEMSWQMLLRPEKGRHPDWPPQLSEEVSVAGSFRQLDRQVRSSGHVSAGATPRQLGQPMASAAPKGAAVAAPGEHRGRDRSARAGTRLGPSGAHLPPATEGWMGEPPRQMRLRPRNQAPTRRGAPPSRSRCRTAGGGLRLAQLPYLCQAGAPTAG